MSEEDKAAALELGWADDRPLTGRRKLQKQKLKKKLKPGSFETMGLGQLVLKGIRRKGYQLPTPIQRKAIPLLLEGQDLVGMARTGSGKTAAFVIPVLERLGAHSTKGGARAVILAPTRELALQTHKVVGELARFSDLRMAALVGGDSMEAQFAELAANPDIIVATPGRLMHHLQEVEGMSLRTVQVCIFDEADRLFEMGFAEQLKAILGRLGEARQTLLFSATMPAGLAEFARAGLKDPQFVRLDAESQLSPDLSLAFFTMRAEDKLAALLWLLRETVDHSLQQSIVFAATRHHVELLFSLLSSEGLPCACVYGAMDQTARRIHIGKFRAGKARILVVTDVAARGLDIPLLDNVVNFDFPAKPKLFVHRAGRAARAGRQGTALSLLTPEELPYALDLHLFLGRHLQPAAVCSLGEAAAAADAGDPQGASLFGAFPQVVLSDEGERIRKALESSADLQGLQRATDNAFMLYRKTRAAASHESVVRARGMPRAGVHPLLARHVPAHAPAGLEAQEGVARITDQLKAYRPSATVLEAEVGKGPRKAGASAPTEHAASLQRVMARKRTAHDSAILAAKQQASNKAAAALLSSSGDPASNDAATDDDMGDAGTGHQSKKRKKIGSSKAAAAAVQSKDAEGGGGRFRDSDFFISPTQAGSQAAAAYAVHERSSGAQGAMDAAVMDLLADDQEGMSQQSKRYHWDKRKRQYVQLQPGEQVRAGKRMRTESGASQRLKDGGGQGGKGLYAKWAKQHQSKVAGVGQNEDPKAVAAAKHLTQRFKNGGRGWQNASEGPAQKQHGGVRSEIRRPEQVRKARKQSDKQRTWQKSSRDARRAGDSGSRQSVNAGRKGAFSNSRGQQKGRH